LPKLDPESKLLEKQKPELEPKQKKLGSTKLRLDSEFETQYQTRIQVKSTHNSNLSNILNSHCQELNALCNTGNTVLAASPLPRQIHRSEQD
jgi:hypothetical protein